MRRRKAEKAQQAAGSADAAREAAELRSALTEIVAESWRFGLALEKVVGKMDPMEGERFARQYSYFATRVDHAAAAAGLTCLDLTGQPYDVGMAVQAMNIDEFDEDEPLVIRRMIEPVIMCGGRVMKTGMAMLGRETEET